MEDGYLMAVRATLKAMRQLAKDRRAERGIIGRTGRPL